MAVQQQAPGLGVGQLVGEILLCGRAGVSDRGGGASTSDEEDLSSTSFLVEAEGLAVDRLNHQNNRMMTNSPTTSHSGICLFYY